jgi:hypothetical protein
LCLQGFRKQELPSCRCDVTQPTAGTESVRIRSFEMTDPADQLLRSRREMLCAAAGGLALSLAIPNRAAAASSGLEPPMTSAVQYVEHQITHDGRERCFALALRCTQKVACSRRLRCSSASGSQRRLRFLNRLPRPRERKPERATTISSRHCAAVSLKDRNSGKRFRRTQMARRQETSLEGNGARPRTRPFSCLRAAQRRVVR